MPKRWKVISDICEAQGYRFGAELGVKEGRFTQHLLSRFPDMRMIAVDLWSPRPEVKGRRGGETYEDWDFDAIKAEFEGRIAPFANRCTVLQTSTVDATNELGDEDLLDFVFIDAEHTYEGVSADIATWRGLVRDGGLIAGHDFNHKWPGVQKAVLEAFNPLDVRLGEDSVWMVFV